MTTGLPIPKPNGKDHSVPFICMNSRCGCMTADDCWKHCCCHTMEEKLAWAEEHGITPPQYVLDQINKQKEESACCHSDTKENTKHTCCEAEDPKPAVHKKSCCCDEACCEAEKENAKASNSISWLVTIQALKCHGHDGWSLLSNTVVVDPTENEPVLLCCLPGEKVSTTEAMLISHPTAPVAPPPKQI